MDIAWGRASVGSRGSTRPALEGFRLTTCSFLSLRFPSLPLCAFLDTRGQARKTHQRGRDRPPVRLRRGCAVSSQLRDGQRRIVSILRRGQFWCHLVFCLVLSYFVLFVLSCSCFSCLVLFCLVLSYFVLSCPLLSCFVLFCRVLSYFVLFCPTLSCFVLFCLVLTSSVLFCPVLSCLVLFCLVWPDFVLFLFVLMVPCLLFFVCAFCFHTSYEPVSLSSLSTTPMDKLN